MAGRRSHPVHHQRRRHQPGRRRPGGRRHAAQRAAPAGSRWRRSSATTCAAAADELGLPDDALFANAYLGARPIVDALDAGRRHRDHRPGGRRVAVPRPARPRARLDAGTTGTGWPPASWSAICSSAAARSPAATSRARGGTTPTRPASGSRSPRSRPTARRSSPSRRAPAAGSSFDTVREQLLYEVHDPAALPQPRRHRRLHVAARSTTSATTACASRARAVRLAPRHLQGPRVHARPAGPGEARLAYSWPDAEAKARAALAFIRGRAEQRGWRSRSGTRSTSASTRSAVPRSRRSRAPTPPGGSRPR